MKKVILSILVILVAIQFIPASRTNPEVVYDFDGPAEVKAILKKSCYDCHSNETQWPWYSHLAPMSWMVAKHVKEGRKHLNFSEWESLRQMGWVRQQIFKEVEVGEMPLKSYLLIHTDAKVSEEDLTVLKKWAEE